MAETITWRSMAGPNFNGVNQALDSAGDRFNQGLGSIAKIGTDMRTANIAASERRKSENTTKALASIVNTKDVNELDNQAANFTYDSLKSRFGDEIDIPSVIDAYQAQKGNIINQQTKDIQFRDLQRTAKESPILRDGKERVTQLMGQGKENEARALVDSLAGQVEDVSGLYDTIDSLRRASGDEQRAKRDQELQEVQENRNATLYGQEQQDRSDLKNFNKNLVDSYIEGVIEGGDPEILAQSLATQAKTPQQVEQALKLTDTINKTNTTLTPGQEQNLASFDLSVKENISAIQKNEQDKLKFFDLNNPSVQAVAVNNKINAEYAGQSTPEQVVQTWVNKNPELTKDAPWFTDNETQGDAVEILNSGINTAVEKLKAEERKILAKENGVSEDSIEPNIEIPASVIVATLNAVQRKGNTFFGHNEETIEDNDATKDLIAANLAKNYNKYKKEVETSQVQREAIINDSKTKQAELSLQYDKLQREKQKVYRLLNLKVRNTTLGRDDNAEFKYALEDKIKAAEKSKKQAYKGMESIFKKHGLKMPELEDMSTSDSTGQDDYDE